MEYQKLNKKAMTCMYVKTWIGSVIWIVVFLVAYFLLKSELPADIQGIVTITIFSLIGVIVIYSLFTPRIRYERYRFLLDDEEFAVRKGLMVTTTEIVPIERLHKIEVSSGPIFRAFGLKEIKVTTAGGEINVSYLDDAIADKIAEHLKVRINTIAVEERNAEEESVMVQGTMDVNVNDTYMEGEHGAE